MAYTTINKSTDYFNTKLYTGNGSASDRTITGVGFQPDFLWNKSRSNTYNHYIFDVLRGTNMISSNTTQGQEDKSPQFSAFTSDGFTIRNDAGSLAINASGVTFANWCWKANGAGSANTDGTINSTVSANTTAGFSIVKWTGSGANATVGHGLGVAPKMIILKNTSEVYGWQVYHASLGNTKYVSLNSTDAQATSSQSWNNTSPTSTVFSVGASDSNNKSGNTIIAYCFAEKAGYSKFGSYTGNGNADGSFIYTGFKPAFVIYKNTTQTDSWFIHDNKRQGYNPENELLFADLSNAESTVNRLDLFSNGFKATDSDKGVNANGNNYIYMAIGQSIVGSNNVPATAR